MNEALDAWTITMVVSAFLYSMYRLHRAEARIQRQIENLCNAGQKICNAGQKTVDAGRSMHAAIEANEKQIEILHGQIADIERALFMRQPYR